MWKTHILGPPANSRYLRFSLILMVFVSPASTSFACVLKRFNFSSLDWKHPKNLKIEANKPWILSHFLCDFMVKAKKSHQTQNIWWFRSIHKNSTQKILVFYCAWPSLKQHKKAPLLLFINWDVTQKSSLFVALGYLIRKTNDHCMKSIILGAEFK